MPKLRYVEHSGREHAVDVESGLSIMDGAVRHGIPGIDGECGGVCSCATCHVYIGPEWHSVLPTMTTLEEEMLEFTSARRADSRLACRLIVNDAFDGLTVNMPESQF